MRCTASLMRCTRSNGENNLLYWVASNSIEKPSAHVTLSKRRRGRFQSIYILWMSKLSVTQTNKLNRVKQIMSKKISPRGREQGMKIFLLVRSLKRFWRKIGKCIFRRAKICFRKLEGVMKLRQANLTQDFYFNRKQLSEIIWTLHSTLEPIIQWLFASADVN